MFLGKGVLKIYIKFTREHPCRSAISVRMPKNTDQNNSEYGHFLRSGQ